MDLMLSSAFDSDTGRGHVNDFSNGPRYFEDVVAGQYRAKEQELLEKQISLARKEQSLREKRHELEAREATLDARFEGEW